MDRNQVLNDPETAFRYAFHGSQAQIWTALPALVTSVDLDLMTIECQPAIKGVATNENGESSFVNLPLLVDVPICFPSAGGFSLTLPIAAGDEVLVVLASRCIDAWWQNGGIQAPMELRMHDLSDGFAIPGPRSQPRVVTGISSTNARLVNDAGTCYLEITPTGMINLVAPGGVTVPGNLIVGGGLEVAGAVTTPSGPLEITGDINVTGQLNTSGEIYAGTIPLSIHVHTGVAVGVQHTGGPIP